MQVINQIQEIEENIARLEKAINDKTPNLKVAHTRLDTRKDRPNVELCRDPVQYRLISEVKQLKTCYNLRKITKNKAMVKIKL